MGIPLKSPNLRVSEKEIEKERRSERQKQRCEIPYWLSVEQTKRKEWRNQDKGAPNVARESKAAPAQREKASSEARQHSAFSCSRSQAK